MYSNKQQRPLCVASSLKLHISPESAESVLASVPASHWASGKVWDLADQCYCWTQLLLPQSYDLTTGPEGRRSPIPGTADSWKPRTGSTCSSFSANIQIRWKRLTDVSGDYCTAGTWTELIYRKDQHKHWGGVRSSFLSCRSFIHHLLVPLQLIRNQHEGCRCLLPTLRTFLVRTLFDSS